YLYDSKVPSRLSEFNKLLGNNYGYSKRVYVQSNGNRMGMDFLYGVKYFLGDDTKNGTTGSDQYAGYGFEPYEQIDGVNVFKNKYDSGLGFGYDKVISETEFGKLGRLAREQAVLQAMVLPDETCETIGEEFIANADDMAIDIDDIDYDIVATDRVEFDGNSFSVENFAEEDTKPGFTIHVNGVKDSQMVVSFDNLIRYNLNGVEAGDFCIKARNNKLVAEANNKKNNQTIGGIVDYDLNMGYYNNYDGNIKITITKPGTYTFDKLYVSAMSTENYDKYAQARLESRYEIGQFDSNHVLGTVDAPSDGFMFFSIPSSKNWSVYVDGKKAEKLSKANITFMAVAIDKGIHQIELKHAVQHKQLATCASAVAVLLIIAMGVISIRSRKRQRRN
ncbi:MAG: YfhO family protein, partial [Eubacterium sp.]|nr:YfhO family protein [Candidatus Colimonas fimequi]